MENIGFGGGGGGDGIQITAKEKREDTVKEEMGLSTELMDPKEIEEELRGMGFLDPSMGVREAQSTRDPIYAILYNAEKEITLPDGSKTTIIDELLRSAHNEFARTCGDTYTDMCSIQETMQTLLLSRDTLAKKIVLLCMIALDEGLQFQLQTMYPQDGGHEVERLPGFVKVINDQMTETFNTAYVNVPYPNIYNVDVLSEKFILACSQSYEA